MMLLADHQIEQWALNGGISPFNKACLNPNSIDITIGNELMVETLSDDAESTLDLVELGNFNEDCPFFLEPGDFALILVAEKIDLSVALYEGRSQTPVALNARAVGKSGRAREGFDLLNAGFAEAGYCGNLTLAVKNHRLFQAQPIWPGKRFAQLLLYPSLMPSSLYQGHYQGNSSVQSSLGHFSHDHQ